MFGLDILLTLANVIYLCSYSVRDILWLRILTVVGASLTLPYYYFQEAPLWAAIAWDTIFIGINVAWIARLFLDRRPAPFSSEEKRLHQLALCNMNDKKAFRLLRMGTRSCVPADTTLLSQGETVTGLMLIVDGEVSLHMNGTLMDTIAEGRFLGGAAYLSKDGLTAPVTARSTKPTHIITWQFKDLESKLKKDTDLQIDIEASLGLEMSRYLQTARVQLLSI